MLKQILSQIANQTYDDYLIVLSSFFNQPQIIPTSYMLLLPWPHQQEKPTREA